MPATKRCLFLIPLFLGALWCHAFPPAPYYVLYGVVRDQVGQTLKVDGATLVLLKGGDEVGRTPLTNGLQIDQNYELKIRIDANRAGTTLYNGNAIPAQSLYSLAVEMNGERFYPIEVSGNLTAGKGGERVRLDLNLGEDSDHDGLPDIWEQWQLYQAGYYPDANGNWAINLIDRNGDFDRDGLSNWFEYIAGTFAGDATERFDLQIKEKTPANVRLEFYAITGKAYTIERSTNMQTWASVPFSVGSATAASSSIHQAAGVGILSAFTVPGSATREFYRLTVR